MSAIVSMAVELAVKDDSTDDSIYIGLYGSSGGREFNLNSQLNDYERGTKRVYVFNDPPSYYRVPLFFETVRPLDERLGAGYPGNNQNWVLADIEHVYIRKEKGNGLGINHLIVHLFGGSQGRISAHRTFEMVNLISYISNESGLQLWLKEETTLPIAMQVASILEDREKINFDKIIGAKCSTN